MGRRFALIVFALFAASVLSVATLAVWIHETGSYRYTFLIWNLFLAWIPLIAAASAFALARRRVGALVVALLVLWLLFFPNAPYVLTDFKHLNENANGASPLWYDALMLASFAWTALMLGFASLYLVHAIVARRANATVGWAVVVAVLGLSSFGVYIGRFVGFNSWDVFTRPGHVLSVIGEQTRSPLHDPKMVGALLALTAFLFVAYLVVYAFAALRPELEAE